MKPGVYVMRRTQKTFDDNCTNCAVDLEGHGHMCSKSGGIFCCECFDTLGCNEAHDDHCETIVHVHKEGSH